VGIQACPVTPTFVAEIGGVDLSQPLAAADEAAIKAAFWKYAVLIFPDQGLAPRQHLDFAQRFGPVETDRVLDQKVTPHRLDPSFADISNLAPDGTIWAKDSRQRAYKAGNRLWHTDSSFKYRPGLASMLYSRTVAPVGGHTEFADERAAYDALPQETKRRLEGLVAEHSIAESRRKSGFTEFNADESRRLPPVPQVMVRTIPESGRKSLYLASHIGRVFEIPEAEGHVLVAELIAHATQRQFVHTHRWRPRDLVMWDNRCTMHRGTDYDDLRWVRDMRRTTVSDVANTCEQAGIVIPA
jgi:alpha-ketoglutarate-dependent 2,4-dichlorophenoxyacetate dioxygenase